MTTKQSPTNCEYAVFFLKEMGSSCGLQYHKQCDYTYKNSQEVEKRWNIWIRIWALKLRFFLYFFLQICICICIRVFRRIALFSQFCQISSISSSMANGTKYGPYPNDRGAPCNHNFLKSNLLWFKEIGQIYKEGWWF